MSRQRAFVAGLALTAVVVGAGWYGRRGGETGVTAVQFMEGPQVWAEMRQGRFSEEVFQAAVDARGGRVGLAEPVEQLLADLRQGGVPFG